MSLRPAVVIGLGFAFLLFSTPSFAGRRGRGRRAADRQGKLKVGDDAPDFDLKRLNAKEGDPTVKLSSFEGKKPVFLIFGSYT